MAREEGGRHLMGNEGRITLPDLAEQARIVARRAPGGAATTNQSCDEAAAPSRCSFATTISGANAYVVEAVGHTRASMAEWRTG